MITNEELMDKLNEVNERRLVDLIPYTAKLSDGRMDLSDPLAREIVDGALAITSRLRKLAQKQFKGAQ